MLANFETLAALLSRPPQPRRYLCGTMLERQLLTLLVAPPGVGKTTLALHLTLALAAGESWGGLAVPGPARVVYVNGEETPDEIQRRLMAVAKQMNVHSRAVLERVLVYVGGGAMCLMVKEGGRSR